MFKIIGFVIFISGNIFMRYTNNFISNCISNFFTNTNTQKYNLTSKAINETITLESERKYQLLNKDFRNKDKNNFVLNFIDYNHTYSKVDFFRKDGFKNNWYDIFSKSDKIDYSLLFNYLKEEHNIEVDLYKDLHLIISNQYMSMDNKVIDMNLFNKYGTIVFRDPTIYDLFKQKLIKLSENVKSPEDITFEIRLLSSLVISDINERNTLGKIIDLENNFLRVPLFNVVSSGFLNSVVGFVSRKLYLII